MSLRDLEKMGLLRPKEDWDRPQSIRQVHPALVGVIAVLAITSVVAMIIGDGSIVTWMAIGGFLICLAIFTVLNVRASGGEEKADDGDKGTTRS